MGRSINEGNHTRWAGVYNSASTSGNTLPFLKGKLTLIYRAFLFIYWMSYQLFVLLVTRGS